MTLIVDANGPLSSRPGLTKVLEEVNKHQAEAKAANGSAVEPAAATNGHAQPSDVATDFAPPTDPERMKRIAELSGATIRQACAQASKAVLDLIVSAEQEVEAIALQAKTDLGAARERWTRFDKDVNEIGDFHASQIEDVLTQLQSVHLITAAVRTRVTELTDSYSQRQQDQAA
jgi:hypothetical protein